MVVGKMKFLLMAALMALSVGLTACDSITPGDPNEGAANDPGRIPGADLSKRKTIWGEGGLNLFGDDEGQPTGGDIGVNSFLWRASLDTISFMPVNSADPFGGVIITDWHANAEAPNERFKLNVYILGRQLRADGIRVAVFRQVLNRGGQWQDASVPEATKTKIEDSILTRARQLRNASVLQEKGG
jgi:hypothetical protein